MFPRKTHSLEATCLFLCLITRYPATKRHRAVKCKTHSNATQTSTSTWGVRNYWTGLYWTQMHAKRYVVWVLIYVPLAVCDVYSYCYLPMQVWRTRTRKWKLNSLELTLRYSAIMLNSTSHCENHLVKLLLQFQGLLNWYVPLREFN